MSVVLIAIYFCSAMREEDAKPRASVRFHFSDKSRRKQKSEWLVRRADALDGQIAVIMKRPFYFDKTSTRIQLLKDPDLTLAVKLKHLEFIRPPPPIEEDIDIEVIGELPPMESSAEKHDGGGSSLTPRRPTLHDNESKRDDNSSMNSDGNADVQELEYKANQSIQIDLFVERKDSSANLLDHLLSDEYLSKELTIARNEQYRTVLVCSPRTIDLVECLGVDNAPEIKLMKLHGPNLALIVLKSAEEYLSIQDHGGLHGISTEARSGAIKNTLSQCMWHVIVWDKIRSQHPDHYDFAPFEDVLNLAQSMDNNMFTMSFLKSLRQHFRSMIQKDRLLAITKRLDLVAVFRFWTVMVDKYLEEMIDHFSARLFQIQSNLSDSAFGFYSDQLQSMKNMINKTDPDSDLQQALIGLTVPLLGKQRDAYELTLKRREAIQRMRTTISLIVDTVTKLEYYVSVGTTLLNLKDRTEKEMKMAVMCDREFLSPEWLRTVPRILNLSSPCISVRRF